jgi:TP901 family phage tail tape measure protein
MADVNANIDINIDSSNALAQLKSLQRQIAQFHTSIAKSSEAAALAQKGLQKNLLNSINSIGAFTAEMRTVKTSAESFTDSLEKNKFSMREYFRYAGASTKTFGRLFKSEFDTIGKVSEERVKRLQTQYIKMGRDANGAMKAISVMPTQLNMGDYTTQVQIAAQKQALFNQLMKQGSTNLLNFGKNTQWAGRQLMVGFTLPLMAVGAAATKTFMEMEAQALRFKKVYGDLFTPQEETQAALDNITELGKQFTKYGVAVSTTVGLAAEAAAAGFQGLDLQRQTTQATRLSILGQVDSQKALETTISLQNAFGMSSENLADSINFLNAVENQTVVSLDDITTAIPKVAPVIQQLGGDVKDLTFFMAAMKEGGINASEGANALKSGLAALINPTGKASDMLASYGINANSIVEKNKGDLKATVIEFAEALNRLDPLARARAIEQMFGKFQFARLSTLFANVAKDGNQASRVLDLANSSVEDLAALSEKELGMTAESAMNKFKKSVEDLKIALVPVGQAFLQAVTPIVDFVGNILEKFANLSDGTKKVITLLTVGIGAVGPVLLMTFGLLANGIANIIKLFLTLRGGYQRLTGQSQILGEQTQYMTMEQLDAAAAAHSLNQTHANLTQTFTAEASAINQLINAYNSAAGASRNFAMNNPGMMMPGRGARKLASGIVSVPGPKGAGDVVPAMLSPGESVIPADMTKKYSGLIQGMIADNIPGYAQGTDGVRAHLTAPFASGSAQYSQGIQMAGLQELAAKYPQFIKVVSNLVAELPQSLNILLEKGTATISQFTSQWDAKTGKMLSSVKSGGGNIKDQAIIDATSQLEQEVRDRTVALAQATDSQNVSDELLSQATREVIDQYKTLDTSIGKVAQALDASAKQVGQVRIQPRAASENMSNAEYVRQMLASGEFTEDASGNIVAGNTRVGRRSRSNPGKVRPASSFNPAGSYTRQPLRGVEAGVESLVDQMDKSARKVLESSSPSRRMKRIGVDAANGLVVGVQEGLANNGITTGGRGSRRATRPQGPAPRSGVPFADPAILSMAYQENVMRDKVRNQARSMQTANIRMDKLNKAFMSGTFALSALSGVASMAGGNLGKFSEILFQISGPMFALSSILQLFTGQKIVSLLTKLGGLKLGLIGAGLIALGIGIKLTNDARKKELEYINGLSNAMKTTTEQVKTLGDFFGVVPTKLPFENRNREIVRRDTRTARDKLRADESFQKEFAPTIKTLSTSTAEQARLAFTSLALNLKAQGFATEQVQTIVDALREEAGKTNVKLDVKSLNFSPESIKGLQDQIAGLLVSFSKDFSVKPTSGQKFLGGFLATLFGETPQVMEMTDKTKKSLSELSTFITETSNSAAGMFRLGLISGEQFESTLLSTVNTMNSLDEASKRVALLEIFKKLDINAAPFLKNLQTAKQEMMLIALLSSGILSKDSPLLTALASTNTGANSPKTRALIRLNALYKELFGAITKVNEEDKKLDGDGPSGQGKLNALQEKIKAIQNQTKAYIILRNAKIDEATATELSNDAEIASLIIANSKGKSLKQIIALVKEYKQALADQTKAEFQYMSGPELFKKQLERSKAQADLREKLIDMQFAPQIKKENDALAVQEQKLKDINAQIEKVTKSQVEPIQAVIDSNNLALEKIALQEDSINEKYNKQIEALDKISSINQDIANIQRQRLSIADALTRGDISTAAQLIQDARAEQAQSAIGGQKDSLTATRDASIAALGRNTIEKQNKELQLQINIIEATQLKTLEAQKQTIEDTVTSINANITALNNQVTVAKEGALYSGKTKQDMDDLDDLIAKATAAGIPFTAELLKQAGSAQALAAALQLALATQKQLGSGATTIDEIKAGAKAGTITAETITPEQKAVVLQSIKDINSKIKGKIAELNKITQGKMYGGQIKYMASGGLARGSDTVPAMLTPGEFVVNKAAAQAYGPLLNSINESKYPSMLGSNGGMSNTPINNISASVSDNSTAVYNYSLGFNINGTNSNPSDIARAVMTEIKRVDAQRIRGQR